MFVTGKRYTGSITISLPVTSPYSRCNYRTGGGDNRFIPRQSIYTQTAIDQSNGSTSSKGNSIWNDIDKELITHKGQIRISLQEYFLHVKENVLLAFLCSCYSSVLYSFRSLFPICFLFRSVSYFFSNLLFRTYSYFPFSFVVILLLLRHLSFTIITFCFLSFLFIFHLITSALRLLPFLLF
jgi:hypothetical protein